VVVTGVVGQGLAIYDTLRRSIAAPAAPGPQTAHRRSRPPRRILRQTVLIRRLAKSVATIVNRRARTNHHASSRLRRGCVKN
jgi:hypothetical protein